MDLFRLDRFYVHGGKNNSQWKTSYIVMQEMCVTILVVKIKYSKAAHE